jgi:mannose-6-phosphate isomerase-like protein (cupin superfamily)
LARALEIPLAFFFEPKCKKPRIINTQKGHRRKMMLDGMFIEDCGLGLDGQPLQPLKVTLPPDMENVTESALHIGHEFVYCLSGKVDYYISDKKYSLFEGDSLVLDASIAHRWINNSDEPAVYLLVMVPGSAGNFNGEVHFQANQVDV